MIAVGGGGGGGELDHLTVIGRLLRRMLFSLFIPCLVSFYMFPRDEAQVAVDYSVVKVYLRRKMFLKEGRGSVG